MNRIRILVVEDDPAISGFIRNNLEYTGYEVNCIADGDEAARHLETNIHYDLALLDIMLPGLDGFQLFDRMRERSIPVIFLTALGDVGSKVKGLRGGAEDYIVKPFEVLELLVRIEHVLTRMGKLDAELNVRNVHIDLENRIVSCEGEEIPLKPMEYELLVMLARYKNRTLPRERLLNEVWGVDYIGGTRTVDVHIAQLRKKLGLLNEIKSISKIGYRLEDK
jgi:DNA-binding response OmpR family regulator